MTAILGISALYHDSAAALLIDGELVAAAQEERFTGVKYDDRFPVNAIRHCLTKADLGTDRIDYVGFYDKPFLKFDRLLETYLAFAPDGYQSFTKAMPAWLKTKQSVARQIDRALERNVKNRYVYTEHHESHAASAFFPSPFDEAAILTLDGVGEWDTAALGTGHGNRVALDQTMHFPHSLGLLYSAFTYYTGFKVNADEYKLMGLAPYGKPIYVDPILDKLIDLKGDGSFRMDLSYFNYCQGLTMTSKRFDALFGAPPRRPNEPIRRLDMDVAASIQQVTEEIVLRIARHLHERTGMTNLCMAGGVALNCVANGRLLREGPFEHIWIQPAAGDAGSALGVAWFIWHQLLGNPRTPAQPDGQLGSLLGSEYTDEDIRAFLDGVHAVYRGFDDEDELCEQVAVMLDRGDVVAWFQGPMEFGPRALGARSILADPRQPDMQSIINMKVKFREGFRPFAPIVLAEHAHEYFDLQQDQESPYMLLVAPVREDKRLAIPDDLANLEGLDRLKQWRSVIPAATHVDYSARIQTVDRYRYPKLRRLLEAFYRRTDCPVLLNTSFNLSWDPIVECPKAAYRTFMSSEIDVLCMGKFVIHKSEQPATLAATARDSSDGLASPCCGADLGRDQGALVCARCDHRYPIDDNIPQLFWPHDAIDDPRDVTEIVKSFYESTPFPQYDDDESVRSLIDKSRLRGYARRLDETIPYNTEVLEVGCGTGQLTNFLGIACRQVVGADLCLNSLKLGERFRRSHSLDRVRFIQMNLFKPPFRSERFDVVICNGVLHHTADPYGGLVCLLRLLKPGGHLIVGLYNRYGRLFTDARRLAFRLTGGHAKWLDPALRRFDWNEDKRRAWFADQYRHPHESKHTYDEVLRWFDETGTEFVRGIPALRLADDGLAGDHLFEPQARGTAADRFIAQLSQILAPGQREGGFFIMIGRKPA